MLQTIGQFSREITDDPHLHLKKFTEVAENFKISGIEYDGFKLWLFPYSLIGIDKACLNSLDQTLTSHGEKFVVKYFPLVLNAKKRNDITSFMQTNEETLFEAWGRYKDMLRMCPCNGICKHKATLQLPHQQKRKHYVFSMYLKLQLSLLKLLVDTLC